MDLWIRSQDKMKLLNNCNFTIENMNDEWWIEDVSYNKFWKLANYKTKERALEVLDEIQSILKPKLIITDTGNPIECSDGGYVYLNQKTELKYQQIGSYVYEMPKE